jgi:hypothetical protein
VPAFVSAADVRGYLELNSSASTSKYTDGAISSNIQAASTFLERATGRWFAERLATTYVATSQGATALAIPGLRSATTVTQQSTTLVADESYHLIADTMQTGLYTAIQFRGFGTRSYSHGYLSNPEWFDRNLDREWARGWDWRYSLPNDVEITGTWGFADADLPYDLRHATKVLAGWYTLRPNSLLANVSVTPEGANIDNSTLPTEVQAFIASWRIGTQVVAVG